jgi:hypothetical protein
MDALGFITLWVAAHDGRNIRSSRGCASALASGGRAILKNVVRIEARANAQSHGKTLQRVLTPRPSNEVSPCSAGGHTPEQRSAGPVPGREKTFACFVDNHHGDGIVAVACKFLHADNKALAEAQPSRFYVPTSHRGDGSHCGCM